MVAVTPDEPVPGSIQARRTEQRSDTLQARSIASDVAVIRMKAVGLGMLPYHEMHRVRRSDSMVELGLLALSLALAAKVPWHRSSLAGSSAGLLREGMSCVALMALGEPAPRTSIRWVGYKKPVGAPRGTE